MLLADRTVIIVDPDPETTEPLSLHLRREGARCFVARDAGNAIWGARETLPDVIVSELELPDSAGETLAAELRSTPECVGVPALGLSANDELLRRVQARHGGIEKYLRKPARPAQVMDAICCLLGTRRQPAPNLLPSLEELAESLEQHDYRYLLAALNAPTAYRFTAFLRSEAGALRSVWTYDRQRPIVDSFGFHVAVDETPCALVLKERESLLIDDTQNGSHVPRAQHHPDMRAFVGVPLSDESAEPSGVLCHFDPEPRRPDGTAFDLFTRVARLFAFVQRKQQRNTDKS
jgi:two-component system OmpR family response regulator